MSDAALASVWQMLIADGMSRRTKTVLLFPLFLVRLILCLIGLLLVWIFMQLLLVGAPTKDPFEPWRENLARSTVRTAGKMMIIASAFLQQNQKLWVHGSHAARATT